MITSCICDYVAGLSHQNFFNQSINLEPIALDGSEHALLIVDVFTKWVKAIIFKYIDFSMIVAWFYKNIVYHYILNAIVQSDSRIEY